LIVLELLLLLLLYEFETIICGKKEEED